ncbi:LysE family transporter [Demequina sp.]|uniref:LysE family transporter n=1 Tax=Demequina sp. TaxID=2050685 RepID=UPI003D0ED953
MTHDLLVLALAGFAAGFAIAMPVGAIAVLILREGMVRGVRYGLAAGAGAASVDLLYCTLAVALGATLSDAIEGALPTLALVSGLVIIGIGVFQLVAAIRAHAESTQEVVAGSKLAVYWRFVALTALNPATIVYFLALSAVVTTVTTSVAGPIVFVACTALASLIWQSALAVVGGLVGANVSERAVRTLGLVAACAIIALGVVAVVAAATRL